MVGRRAGRVRGTARARAPRHQGARPPTGLARRAAQLDRPAARSRRQWDRRRRPSRRRRGDDDDGGRVAELGGGAAAAAAAVLRRSTTAVRDDSGAGRRRALARFSGARFHDGGTGGLCGPLVHAWKEARASVRARGGGAFRRRLRARASCVAVCASPLALGGGGGRGLGPWASCSWHATCSFSVGVWLM